MTGYRRTEVEIAVVSDVNFRRPLVIPSGSPTAQVDSQPSTPSTTNYSVERDLVYDGILRQEIDKSQSSIETGE